MHRIEAYIRLALIFIVIISILYLPILLILKKKRISVVRQISYLGLICSAFLIIFATILFVPINFEPEQYSLNLIPLKWIGSIEKIQEVIVEKMANILLFIPFGCFLPIVYKSKRKIYQTAFISFSITFCIEFFQYFIGRSSDIDDVITNFLGALIGYGIFKVLHIFAKEKKWWNQLLGNIKID